MTDDRVALPAALQQADDGTFLRSVALMVLQIRMAAVEGLIGAGRHEQSGACPTWCRGCRDRALDTRLGQRNRRLPKRRTGSWLPPLLEAGKTTEKALISVIRRPPEAIDPMPGWSGARRPDERPFGLPSV